VDVPNLRAEPDGTPLVGHLVRGGGPARVVSARALTAEGDPPEESGHAAVWHDRDRPGTAPRGGGLAFVGIALHGGGGITHGINAAGVVVAGTAHGTGRDAGNGTADSAARIAALTRRILEHAADVDAAIALSATALEQAGGLGAAVQVAGRTRSATVTASEGVVRVDDTTASRVPSAAGDWPRRMLDEQRRHAATDPAVAAALAARLGGAGPEVLLCAGPPHCGVAIRYWPGIDVAPQTAQLADLSQRLAAAVADRPELLTEVERALSPVRAQVLDEGDDAERLAALMDRDGDDRGGEVRRGVAQFRALGLAVAALQSLVDRLCSGAGTAGPAPRPNL
jgi:hypothetical protein